MNLDSIAKWGLMMSAALAIQADANPQPAWMGTDQPLSSPQQQALKKADEWLAKPQQPTLKNNRLQFIFGAGRSMLICAPLQVCAIELEPGELVTQNGLQLGDTARWHVTPIVGAEAQTHLMVKPLAAGLDTTMVIITDRRAYHLQMISTAKQFMPAISWHYPERQQQAWQQYQDTREEEHKKTRLPNTRHNLANLNFNYAIKHCQRCPFRPVRVYDDSSRVYIEMPWQVTQLVDLPALLITDNGIKTLANYRFINNRFVVDQLFTRALLTNVNARKLEKVEIIRQ